MPSPAATTRSGTILNLLDPLKVYSALVPHDGDHTVQVALRTYSLALVLSLGSRLLPFLTSSKARARALRKLPFILKREFGPSGFAFSITLAVSGGKYLQDLLTSLKGDNRGRSGHSCSTSDLSQGERSGRRVSSRMIGSLTKLLLSLSEIQRAFILNSLSCTVAAVLLNSRRKPPSASVASIPMTLPFDDMPRRGIPPTLDLTLLLFVRAVDSVVHSAIHDRVLPNRRNTDQSSSPELIKEVKQWWVSHLDAVVFSLCSARIIWCFFYEPERLPTAYVKWITTLAEIDPCIPSVLRSLRNGSFSYIKKHAASDELATFSKRLGYPSSWGNPALVPAYGTKANEVWRVLRVQGRNGIGGVPCELVHGGNGAGSSCMKNVGIRGSKAFLAAIAIYLPVHLLPVALTRPKQLLNSHNLIPLLLGAVRSATFLSSFVSFMWFGVCSTRTMLLPRLFPFISHDYFDGPFGCIYLASLICGSSICIEHERRRGEISLYVLPRAIRACLSDNWLKSGGIGVKVMERLVFALSLATLLTRAVYRPDSLRGLSRWTLSYIMNGSGRRSRRDNVLPEVDDNAKVHDEQI